MNAAPGHGPFDATVVRIVDGDTLYLSVDLSFRVFTTVSIRLAGIDASELFSGPDEERERGKAAATHLEMLLPPGTPCVLTTYKDRRSFNRYIGDVRMGDGTDVARVMIEAGHAVPYEE